jgi:hypothetical protein
MVEQLKLGEYRPDMSFDGKVSEVIRLAETNHGIPSEAEITRRIYRAGARGNAFNDLLSESRAHLSRHFLELDKALKSQVGQMQEDVAALLADQGELRPLSSGTGRDFLLDVAERVHPADAVAAGEKEKKIAFALRMLADFELAFRGLIQHRIRPCLDKMYPDDPLIPLGDKLESMTAEEIRDNLEVTYVTTLRKCEEKLAGIVAEPNGALFAIVEEFRDRVLRATASESAWMSFYHSVMAEVWAGPLGEVAARSGRYRGWNENVEALRGCARAVADGGRDGGPAGGA